jgi:hypothetical protein
MNCYGDSYTLLSLGLRCSDAVHRSRLKHMFYYRGKKGRVLIVTIIH